MTPADRRDIELAALERAKVRIYRAADEARSRGAEDQFIHALMYAATLIVQQQNEDFHRKDDDAD